MSHKAARACPSSSGGSAATRTNQNVPAGVVTISSGSAASDNPSCHVNFRNSARAPGRSLDQRRAGGRYAQFCARTGALQLPYNLKFGHFGHLFTPALLGAYPAKSSIPSLDTGLICGPPAKATFQRETLFS